MGSQNSRERERNHSNRRLQLLHKFVGPRRVSERVSVCVPWLAGWLLPSLHVAVWLLSPRLASPRHAARLTTLCQRPLSCSLAAALSAAAAPLAACLLLGSSSAPHPLSVRFLSLRCCRRSSSSSSSQSRRVPVIAQLNLRAPRLGPSPPRPSSRSIVLNHQRRSPHPPFHTSLSLPSILPPSSLLSSAPISTRATRGFVQPPLFPGTIITPARSRLSSPPRASDCTSLVPSHRPCSQTLHRASRWPAHPTSSLANRTRSISSLTRTRNALGSTLAYLA